MPSELTWHDRKRGRAGRAGERRDVEGFERVFNVIGWIGFLAIIPLALDVFGMPQRRACGKASGPLRHQGLPDAGLLRAGLRPRDLRQRPDSSLLC